jgi:glycosyltransferase involved in cell wall biosynthesis
VRQIFLMIPVDYAAGGLQRSALALRDCLERAGYRVVIYCFKLLPGGLAGEHPFVMAIARERRSKLLFWAATITEMRRMIRSARPHAVIAFGTVPSIILPAVTAFSGVPLAIGGERGYPGAEGVPPLIRLLRRITFPRLDFIVCQTERTRNWFRAHMPLKDPQLVIIPNIVAAPSASTESRRSQASSANILCVGRLDEEKGFALALDIIAKVLERVPEATLTVVGEGPLHYLLEAKAAELGVATRVRFAGRTNDLTAYWTWADLFLLTSLHEGFPNALAEAMANGVAPVAFDCPTGPSELIESGVNGYLVPLSDIEAASARCIELLADPDKRSAFGERAREVPERFSASRIGELWRQLVESGPAAQVRSAR